MSLFLIEKSWYDSLTSIFETDCGYDILGYVESEDIAKHIVTSGGEDKRPCIPQPMFRYTKIEKYNHAIRRTAGRIGHKSIACETDKESDR